MRSLWIIYFRRNLSFSSQCLLGLCDDNSLGGDCLSPLSSARFGSPFIIVCAPSLVLFIFLCYLMIWHLSSEQRWDGSSGEPGRHPETAVTLPEGGAPPPVPHLPGDWPAASRTARPAALESERKGQHKKKEKQNILYCLVFHMKCAIWTNSTLIHRERFSPNCARGVHTAHVTLYQIRKTMKQPITCFESSFPAIRWSSVSVSNLPAMPPW